MNLLTLDDLTTTNAASEAILARCVPDLTCIDMYELAAERQGNTPKDIASAIVGLLDGLAVRHADDEVTLAVVCAIRDWHLPDLLGQ